MTDHKKTFNIDLGDFGERRYKYKPLYNYLCQLNGMTWRATFSEIEDVLGLRLPNSARTYRPWWGNVATHTSRPSQTRAWMAAGYKIGDVDLQQERVTFMFGDSGERRHKYEPLYDYLCQLDGMTWRATFSEVEDVLGFRLPDSARTYRPWWGNVATHTSRPSQTRAWMAAG
ncbi:MAG: hypothetical protein GDA54_07110, partial [Alphaproteobacteria bacterium GM7ARS4]|nr:hypothetical protein [Alphaproteobacteria bacterium GM7ARS4]